MPYHVWLQTKLLCTQVVVEQLRQLCLEEGKGDAGSRGYSALTQGPDEWALEAGKPCSGERLLLMFDRWRKLAKVSMTAGHTCWYGWQPLMALNSLLPVVCDASGLACAASAVMTWVLQHHHTSSPLSAHPDCWPLLALRICVMQSPKARAPVCTAGLLQRQEEAIRHQQGA